MPYELRYSQRHDRFALLPLDDEVLDLMLSRHPGFTEECHQIRERMQKGEYLTHEQMLAALSPLEESS